MVKVWSKFTFKYIKNEFLRFIQSGHVEGVFEEYVSTRTTSELA